MSDAEKEALSELKDIQGLLSSYTSKIKMVLIHYYFFMYVHFQVVTCRCLKLCYVLLLVLCDFK